MMHEPAPLLLKLFAAHLFGDYIVQSPRVADQKHRGAMLGLHVLLHGALLALVSLTEPASTRLWLALAALLAAHAAIDAWTSRLKPRDLRLLVIDQSLHAATLIGAVAVARPLEAAVWARAAAAAGGAARLWTLLAGAGAAVWMGAVVVGRWVEPFAAHLGERHPGLARAGRMIGLIERALIFIAVLLRIEALVGFVVAAKAILRFPEIREPGHQALAEYYLVGSLASVLWAVVIGVLTRWALTGRP